MAKNKIKPLMLFLLGMLYSLLLNAQSIAPQSVNCVGVKLSQSSGSLCFTVGELIVSTLIDVDGNTIGSGFTSGSTIITVNIKEPDVAILNVKVFPNPTTEMVNIQINQSKVEQVVVSVTDLLGKEVYYGKYAGLSNTIGINIADYSSGTYILFLKDINNQLLGTFKIIKQ